MYSAMGDRNTPDATSMRAPPFTENRIGRSLLVVLRIDSFGVVTWNIAKLPKGGDAGALAPIVNHCLDAFGPDRVVFGSDWPVCLLGASLGTWVAMLTEIIAGRPESDRRKLWSENATKFYQLKF